MKNNRLPLEKLYVFGDRVNKLIKNGKRINQKPLLSIGNLTTGGTGFTTRDSTPEALTPLFDVEITGFGELFRQLSYEDIGTSTVQSRAFAGIANNTVIFCVPGSTGACRTAWEGIIAEQLDSRHRPCNFVGTLLGSH